MSPTATTPGNQRVHRRPHTVTLAAVETIDVRRRIPPRGVPASHDDHGEHERRRRIGNRAASRYATAARVRAACPVTCDHDGREDRTTHPCHGDATLDAPWNVMTAQFDATLPPLPPIQGAKRYARHAPCTPSCPPRAPLDHDALVRHGEPTTSPSRGARGSEDEERVPDVVDRIHPHHVAHAATLPILLHDEQRLVTYATDPNLTTIGEPP